MRKANAQGSGPFLVHVVTQKGKGYAPAEAAADKYHGVARFDVISGKQNKPVSNAPSYTSVFANALIREAEKDERITAITAAMPGGTGVDKFAKAHPERAFDVGIAERYVERLAVDRGSAERIFARILDEHATTLRLLGEVTGSHDLLADNPVLARSITNRFPYLDPLHVLQVDLLERLRAGDEGELVQRGIQLTLNAIATGLRNSG